MVFPIERILLKSRKDLKVLYKLSIILLVHLLTACSSMATGNTHYQVIEEHVLANELKETSGLYCPEQGMAFTVNDSGNESVIYKINHDGKVIHRQKVDIKNRDWEALTGDENNFYIGDIGNNQGKRKFVQILTVEKRDPLKIKETIKVYYLENSIKKNEYLNHNFDAESLIKVDDSVYLFSKSWRTGSLFIYELNPNSLEHKVKPTTIVKGLPGIVTGGDYDAKRKRFILTGYELKGLGRFYPFIAILDRQLNLLKSFIVDDYHQVEGLCVTPKGDVWITQEGTFFARQKLIKLKVY